MNARIRFLALLTLVVAGSGFSAGAAGPDCASLADLALPETAITLAVEVPAGTLDPPGRTPLLAELPAICRVVGTIEPAIGFEVWMPLEGWNGKFQGVGNGGMAGTVSYGAMAGAVARGYATASTDTGHVASGNAFDARWALGRPDLIEDFGHLSLHLTTVRGKAIVERYYGSAPRYAYYVGCSKGGQQGLMEAQRYPEDYDGIVAGNPANDWTRFYAGAHLWYSLATLDDPESYLTPTAAQIVGRAVDAACDGIDGVQDGILDDPRRCDFDPASLVCEDSSGDSCLSLKQAAAVTRIWAGSRNGAGERIYPGLVPGGEGADGGWSTWVTGTEPFSSLHWLAAEGFFKYMVFDDPDWDFRTFDFDRDLPLALAKVGKALDAADPDLRPLEERGAKLLVYHGWSDADISPLASIDYFQQVVSALSGDHPPARALDRTRDFFRLFMVPGMGHCRGGPGPDRFDALGALERWVEDGVAPTRIIASQVHETGTRSRPLCPYPEVARWSGSGSPDEAGSYRCVAP